MQHPFKHLGKTAAKAVAIVALAALTPATHAAPPTFDTTPLWDGANPVGMWGHPNTATYGQTFFAPENPVLTDFSFFIAGDETVALSYKAFVMEWLGPVRGFGGSGGALLWSSPSTAFIGDIDVTYQEVSTTIPGGLELTTGNPYVIGLTISDPDDYNSSAEVATWGFLPYFTHADPEVGGGGGFVFYNNAGGGFASLADQWDTFEDFGDVAFTANFSPAAVPEPSSYFAFTLLGYLGFCGVRRFRRNRA